MDNIPIASLTRDAPPPSSKCIRAIVTLVWPFSSSLRQCAFLLAEPDFRLRYRRGQVRVRFGGPSAGAVAKLHIGIGDEVTIKLWGARWEEETGHIRTPGKSVDGELVFQGKLDLRVRNATRDENVHIDEEVWDVDETRPMQELFATPRARITNILGSAGPNIVYASPAFTKRIRLSGGKALDSGYDPFLDDDDSLVRKKPRKPFENIRVWRYADRTPSPSPSVVPTKDEIAPTTVESFHLETRRGRTPSPPIRSDHHDEMSLAPTTNLNHTLAGPDDRTASNEMVDSAGTLPTFQILDSEIMATEYGKVAQAQEDFSGSNPPPEASAHHSDQPAMSSPLSLPIEGEPFYPDIIREVLEPMPILQDPDEAILANEVDIEKALVAGAPVGLVEEADTIPLSPVNLPLATPDVLMQDIGTIPYSIDDNSTIIPEVLMSDNPVVSSSLDDGSQTPFPIMEDYATSLIYSSPQMAVQETQLDVPYDRFNSDVLNQIKFAEDQAIAVDQREANAHGSTNDDTTSVVGNAEASPALKPATPAPAATVTSLPPLELEPNSMSTTRSPQHHPTTASGETPESAKGKVMAQTLSSLFGFDEDDPPLLSPLEFRHPHAGTSENREDSAFFPGFGSVGNIGSFPEVPHGDAHMDQGDWTMQHNVETIPGNVEPIDHDFVRTNEEDRASQETEEPELNVSKDLPQDIDTGVEALRGISAQADTSTMEMHDVTSSTLIPDASNKLSAEINEQTILDFSQPAPQKAKHALFEDTFDLLTPDAGQENPLLGPTAIGSVASTATSGRTNGALAILQSVLKIDTFEQQDPPPTLLDDAARPPSASFHHDEGSSEQFSGTQTGFAVIHSPPLNVPTPSIGNETLHDAASLVEDEDEDVEVEALLSAEPRLEPHQDSAGDEDPQSETGFGHDMDLVEFGAVEKYRGIQFEDEPVVMREVEMGNVDILKDEPDMISVQSEDMADPDVETSVVQPLDPGRYDTDAAEWRSAVKSVKSPEESMPAMIETVADDTHVDLPQRDSELETLTGLESVVVPDSKLVAFRGTEIDQDDRMSLHNTDDAFNPAGGLSEEISESGEAPSLQVENPTRSTERDSSINQTPESTIMGRNLPIASRTRSRLSIAEVDMIKYPERRTPRKLSDDELIAEQLQTELRARSGDSSQIAATPSRGYGKSTLTTDKTPLPLVPESHQEVVSAAPDTHRLRSSMRRRTDVSMATPKTPMAPPKTPARTSFASRVSQLPDAITAWFSPKASGDTPSRATRSHRRTRSEQSNDASQSAVSFTTLEEAFSTPLAYFTPLARLQKQTNPLGTNAHGTNLFDVIAVCSGDSSGPERAKSGPKDFYTVIHLTDASLERNTSVSVEVFRPWKAKLPRVAVGDVVLLRAFAIKSRKHKPYLISTDTSAYCVWRLSKSGTHVQNKDLTATLEVQGPPIELGEEEEQRAKLLRAWWLSVQQDARQISS